METTSPIGLTREDIVIYLRRTSFAQRIAYRTAHQVDASTVAHLAMFKARTLEALGLYDNESSAAGGTL